MLFRSVLTNLTLHWWYSDRKPFPRSTTIARRMGVDVRTVQRSLAHLAELGLVVREKTAETGAETFDLSGLVRKLNVLALSDASYRYRVNDALGNEGAVQQDVF